MTSVNWSELAISETLALPLEVVTEATAIVATRGAGKSSGSAVIVEEAFGLSVQSVILDRTGVYWGLRSNRKGNGPGLPIYVLGGPHGDVPLEPHAGSLIADLVVDTGHSFVLDLSDFSKSAAVRFTADFLEQLYDRKARSRTTTLLVVDEAHFYAPQTPRGGFKGDSARLMGAMEDVVGLGRSRGLGVVLTTQRTQALNKAILDLIETLIVMRMLSPRARAAVRDWIQEKHEEDELGVIASLDSLPTGTAWVWSPLRAILEKAALRRIRTFDSYATPKPGEAQVEPTAREQLDLASLGEQIAATAERAKENDPNELRKRIRELEAALAAAPAEERQIPNTEDEPAWDTYFREQGWLNPSDPDFPDRAREFAPAEPLFTDADREQLSTIAVELDGLRNHFDSTIDPLRVTLEALAARAAEKDAHVASTPPARRPVPRVAPAAVLPAPRPVAAPPNGAVNVSGSAQKILDAVAWYEELGIRQPTRLQVGLVSGYKQGGRFNNLLTELRGEHLVDTPTGFVVLTTEGRALAQGPRLPRTATALQEAVIATLPPSEARVLQTLLEAGRQVTRAELAELTNYAVAGRFNNILSRLKSLGLVETGGGVVYPAAALYPNG